MRWTDLLTKLNIRVDRQAVRQFGWILAGLLIVVTGIQFVLSSHLNVTLLLLAGAIALAATLFPRLISIIYFPWMILARLIGMIITYLILIIVYFIMLTPVGLIRCWTGKDTLRKTLHFDRYRSSYWRDRESRKPSDFERMF